MTFRIYVDNNPPEIQPVRNTIYIEIGKDTEAPVITGLFDLPGNRNGVVVLDCWPLLTVHDVNPGTNPGDFLYSLSDSGPWYSVEYDKLVLDTTDPGPGVYPVYLKARDKAGNESDIYSALITVPSADEAPASGRSLLFLQK